MLISYPVLPSDAFNDDEDVYLDNILNGYVLDGEGRYPVTTLAAPTGLIHRWHGGIHMQSQGQPIRAIADGVVVAYRFAPACETYEGLGDYDTSFVLIRHETETGENTPVVFYSLTMHLASRQDLLPDRYSQLPPWMKQAGPSTEVRRPNQKVWRKDVVGFAGKLYDREACHFEVFTTDEAFGAFWRDSLFIEGHGSDDCFGDTHFVIPAGQAFHARHPRAAPQGAHRIDFDAHAHYGLPVGQDGRNEGGGDVDRTLYVSVKLHKGTRIATTYTWDRVRDRYVPLGAPVQQEGYEYELYRLATALYSDCPSAGCEWLRYGRGLGPDRSTRQESWHLVRYAADKVGYIDLAHAQIVKLSDADFPHWHGWEKHDQGRLVGADDGLCTDEAVIALAQASDEDSKKKLRRLICKHPSEWDASDLATRYAGLREPDQPLHEDESWSLFEQHVKKLAFWAEAGLPQRSVWHFHPLQFIRHFRRCGWLSAREFVQLLPQHAVRTQQHGGQTQVLWEPVPAVNANPERNPVLRDHRVPLNKTMRKHGIDTPMRQACFFGNAVQETSWLGSLAEYAGSRLWYAPWYGRGFLQLTNPGNYCDYWAWRGREVDPALRRALAAAYATISQMPGGQRSNERLRDANFSRLTQQMVQWRDHVASATQPPKSPEDFFAPSDSAGFYWLKNRMAQYADEPHVIERCTVQTDHGRKVYYRSMSFWRASAAVNLPSAVGRTHYTGLNGFDSRCCAYGVALAVLSDVRLPDADGRPTIEVLEGGYQRRDA